MGQISTTLNDEILQKMQYFYEGQMEQAPQGAIFRARTNNAVITAYKSGKVLFQGANAEEEASIWTTFQGEATQKNMPKNETNPYTPKQDFFQKSHIGSDESGTGDYFGPVTAAAVYVPDTLIPVLKKMGIQDSKAMKDDTIERLAHELMDVQIHYSLMTISNDKYNQLQRRGWSQGKMKAMIHHGVITSLLQKMGTTPYEGILIDQFCMPHIYKRHIESEGNALLPHTYFMTKAENASIAVAAGSVLARYRYVKEMDRLSELVGFSLQKGASKKVDQQIAKIIHEHGKAYLENIAKVHFANTKKAEKYL